MLDKFFPTYLTVFFISLLITFMVEKRMLPVLCRSAAQPIYEDGPRWHMKKSGTPTMGGIAFIISISLSLILGAMILLFSKSNKSTISIVLCQLYATFNGMVGLFDDLKKIKRRNNKGLTPIQKLIFQFIIAALFLTARHFLISKSTEISFSFGKIDLGSLYYPITIILLVGIVNCANITDGVDGLASSVAFSIGVSLLYISCALNAEVSIIASTIIGGSISFLIFNLHPAKVFMGDTGSLYFGALIACTAVVLDNPIIIIFVAGFYALEGASVIMQVLWYKLFKKRIFLMAPLHHHLERLGWSENKICIVAIILTFIFSIPAYVFYLP